LRSALRGEDSAAEIMLEKKTEWYDEVMKPLWRILRKERNRKAGYEEKGKQRSNSNQVRKRLEKVLTLFAKLRDFRSLRRIFSNTTKKLNNKFTYVNSDYCFREKMSKRLKGEKICA